MSCNDFEMIETFEHIMSFENDEVWVDSVSNTRCTDMLPVANSKSENPKQTYKDYPNHN